MSLPALTKSRPRLLASKTLMPHRVGYPYIRSEYDEREPEFISYDLQQSDVVVVHTYFPAGTPQYTL